MIKEIKNKKNIFFFVCFAAAAFFIFWKCSYGFSGADESFVLSIPLRLVQGDGLFVNEWHLSQMAGFLVYPLVALFLRTNGSTEGIFLFFRYIYSLIQCIAALYIYLRLKNQSWIGSLVAAICTLLYAPYGIMTLSYNTLCITCLLLCLVTIVTAKRYKQLQYFIAGVFFSFSVLCCPFLVFVYIAYLLIFLLSKKHKVTHDVTYNLLESNCVGYVTLGSLIVAIIFMLFVFSRASIAQLFDSLPWIMNDPEHRISFWYKFALYFRAVLMPNISTPIVYLLFVILFVIYWRDKLKQERRHIYFITATIFSILLFLSHYFGNHYINDMMWPINVLAFFVFILTKNTSIKNVFYTLWIPGILYGFCINISSNQTYHAIFSASSVATVGSIVMVGMFIRELNYELNPSNWKKLCSIVVATSFILQLITVGFLRYEFVFGENDIYNLTEQLTTGPQAGLYVSPETSSEYKQAEEEMAALAQYKPKKVLFLSKKTWLYFMENYEISTFSVWLSGVNEFTTEKLLAYYALNPEKKPDAIYAEAEDEPLLDILAQALEMNKITTSYGSLLIN